MEYTPPPLRKLFGNDTSYKQGKGQFIHHQLIQFDIKLKEQTDFFRVDEPKYTHDTSVMQSNSDHKLPNEAGSKMLETNSDQKLLKETKSKIYLKQMMSPPIKEMQKYIGVPMTAVFETNSLPAKNAAKSSSRLMTKADSFI